MSIKHWDEFNDVADHCTVCHKCATPCPVKIDFGDVTMNMRNLLRKMQEKFNAGNAAGMFFLNATNPQTINVAQRDDGRRLGTLRNDMLKVVTKQTSTRPRRSASRRWSSR